MRTSRPLRWLILQWYPQQYDGNFASVISNNLNIVMKVLAVITIVMSIPTIVFSAYGMNLSAAGMPFSRTPWGFLIVIILSVVASIIAAIFLSRKKFF